MPARPILVPVRYRARVTHPLHRAMAALGLALVAAVAGQLMASSLGAPVAATAAIGAAMLLGALLARTLARAATSRQLTVGHRARAHREPVSRIVEPAHPLTAGRPLCRAPAAALPAA